MAGRADLLVLGAGPGGYAAAFLAADLGLQVTLVDPEPSPGGVCLHRGCIPSKTLLHLARVIAESRQVAAAGILFGEPRIDLDRVRRHKDAVIARLASGLGEIARLRRVRYVQGRGALTGTSRATIAPSAGGSETIAFGSAIIATGSAPATLPFLPASPRVLDSTAALDLTGVPARLLVIGGGYIGLEMGTVYAALGSRVTVVEMTETLLPGVDLDLVRPLASRLGALFEAVQLKTRVAAARETASGIAVRLEGEHAGGTEPVFDAVLVATGRKPVTAGVGIEKAGLETTREGFLAVDAQRRTTAPNLFAIGDVAGQPMLAHKAAHEGRTAAEAIAGGKAAFAPRAIPAVVFTDPEIAWCGLSESEAVASGLAHEAIRYPWAASGRAVTLGRTEGVTKLLLDPASGRILGVGICGPGAGDLIAEGVVAMEMGATAEDLRLSIHPHPTLSETLMEAADLSFGQSTHLYRPRRGRTVAEPGA